MKNLFYIILLAVFIYNCSSGNRTMTSAKPDVATVENDTIKIVNDSLDYEIIIFEPGFNSWLVTQRPRHYYTQNYLEQKNWRYVIEYNSRVVSSRYNNDLYPQTINYEGNIDYGYEVNYLLFNYFQFFQQQYNQNLY